MRKISSGRNTEINNLFSRLRNENSRDEFKQLFLIYFPRLNDYAGKIIKDGTISQDIVQDVFAKLWENRNNIDDSNIEAYLFRAIKNRCLDYIRHIKVVSNFKLDFKASAKVEELYRIDFAGDEPYILIEKELETEIQRVIQSLPERCREVFILSRIRGLRNKEIAEKLGINIKNVERHISKALNIFKSRFANNIPVALIFLVIRNIHF